MHNHKAQVFLGFLKELQIPTGAYTHTITCIDYSLNLLVLTHYLTFDQLGLIFTHRSASSSAPLKVLFLM